MTHILDEAIALFDNGNYSGQTIRKMLRELKEKRPGEPVQCPHWLIGRVIGIDGDTNEYFCNAQSEREKVLDELTNRIHKKQNEIPAGGMYGGLVWVMGEILELRKGGRE